MASDVTIRAVQVIVDSTRWCRRIGTPPKNVREGSHAEMIRKGDDARKIGPNLMMVTPISRGEDLWNNRCSTLQKSKSATDQML